MSYDKNIYLKLLSENKFEEANSYRTDNMPKSLFKYISLNGDTSCEQFKKVCKINFDLNELKFNSLQHNKLWLSTFENLNDPFEYKALFLDTQKLEAHNYPIDYIESAFKSIKDMFVITSFTTTAIDNMPMWAHYSNNHQGFCIEYEVISPRMIFPISYEKNRNPIASIITHYMNIANKLSKREITEDNNDYQKYVHIMLHSAFIKHESWMYEDLYRLVYINPKELPSGVSYPLDTLGLKVKRIFIGRCCSAENRQRLVDTARHNGFEVFDVILEEQSKLYRLETKVI